VFENGMLEGESRQAEHELTDYPHRDGMLLWMRF
jgi:hypothetical protein